MVLKHVFAATIGAMLAWGAPAVAAEYQSDEYQAQEYQADEYQAYEFLGLDLSKAVLSPRPLGPPTQFAPVVRHLAKADPESPPAPASTNSKAISERAIPKPRVTHQGVKKPRGAGRTTLARRHGNPLDAQAFDTRIQVWPCRSGGICNWQRP
jgi:hypothetical protein